MIATKGEIVLLSYLYEFLIVFMLEESDLTVSGMDFENLCIVRDISFHRDLYIQKENQIEMLFWVRIASCIPKVFFELAVVLLFFTQFGSASFLLKWFLFLIAQINHWFYEL